MYLCPFFIGLLFGFLDLRFDTFAGMSSVVVEAISFETVFDAYISFSINSRRPLTAMTASVLSCFNKTGPTSL